MNPFVTYKGVCEKIIMIDSPGFNPQNLTADMYRHLGRRIYPIHEVGLDEKIVQTY